MLFLRYRIGKYIGQSCHVYSEPHQFEPLLPQKELGALVEATRVVIEESLRLQRALPPSSRTQLQELVREMNSYYSNLIEGQSTHPRNIKRALQMDFSTKPDIAKRQRIALAHIQAEKELEQRIQTDNLAEAQLLNCSFLLLSHKCLYTKLSPEDRTTADGRIVEPGQIRQVNVDVGTHIPPTHQSILAFLRRMDQVYSAQQGLDTVLYTIAAAHHRAAWVHPFGDGNGRACRLQTHCALFPLSCGIWSVSRGMARQRDKYYEMLGSADLPRQGDLDGRGNLTESGLRKWCGFFIDMCLDQVRFMSSTLELDGLKSRIAALVAVRAQDSNFSNYRSEAVLPLHHVLVAGPVSRGEFCQMSGLGERTARRMLAQLLQDGLLKSEQAKGAVSIGFPLDALSVLFPNLYPEAATANLDA